MCGIEDSLCVFNRVCMDVHFLCIAIIFSSVGLSFEVLLSVSTLGFFRGFLWLVSFVGPFGCSLLWGSFVGFFGWSLL